ncbi:MAG: CsgG/HfaB family protein [Treponemataceae bacterium]|nr:CsgG/HfaB family protein [Treponemataceae bacterium]
MKKILAILFVLIFACNLVFGASITDELKGMANQLVQVKAGVSKPSYAFVALTTDYKNTLVDNYVTDALTEAMFNTGKVKIIERANVETILQEQKFQSSGLVNEETVKSIGMIAGVDFVCYGTLKDLGASLTVNARVVDVETGELCAIARTTILKDEYLQRQVQSAVGTPSIATTKTATTSTGSIVNNAWEVTSYTDEFGGYTKYIFTIKSTDEKKLLLSYQKYENSAYNRVISGIYWGYGGPTNAWGNGITNNAGTYDIKGQGETVTKKVPDAWQMYYGPSNDNYFWFAWDSKAGSRWLVDILVNSDTVSVRRDGLSRKFQTAGLLDKMAEYGITWEEIDNAMANEEF